MWSAPEQTDSTTENPTTYVQHAAATPIPSPSARAAENGDAEVVDDGRVGSALAMQAFSGTLSGIVSPVIFGAAVDYSGGALAFQT